MTTSAASSPPRPWLIGPFSDLLFGCGLAWIAVALFRIASPSDLSAIVPGALLLFVLSVPHYGATLTLVYETAESRRRTFLLATYGSLFLVGLFGLTLYSPLVGSAVLTIYLTWSPWHYTGQNYGILLALLGRRGVRPDASLKRLIHGSFVLSFLLTFFSIHGSAQATYAPVTYAGTLYRLLPLPIPEFVSSASLLVLGFGYTGCISAVLFRLGRQASLRSIAPCLVILGLQASWFSVPALLRQWEIHFGGLGPVEFYSAYGFLWIAAAHAAQYLWFCTYYAGKSATGTSPLAYLGKSYLAGISIWVLPGVILGPALFGAVEIDASFALMAAAVVNLHHFVLDGAIWKLRERRFARIFFRSENSSTVQGTSAATPSSAIRNPFVVLIAVTGSIAIGVTAFKTFEQQVGFPGALDRGDLVRAERSLDRLEKVGAGSARARSEVARRHAGLGNIEASARQFARSLEIQPTAEAWSGIAVLQSQTGQPQQALASYRAALEIDPTHIPSLLGAGMVLVANGKSQNAITLFERAAALEPTRPDIQSLLANARRKAESP